MRNRQRVRRVDRAKLRELLRGVLAHLSVPGYELGLHLVDAPEMATLNQTYLQHEGSTDVITFDHSDAPPAAPVPPGTQALHGEIYISVPDALAQAHEFGTHWTEELVRYAVHGLLHLLGHDDRQPAARRAMKRIENHLVQAIAAEHRLAALGRAPRPTPNRRRHG